MEEQKKLTMCELLVKMNKCTEGKDTYTRLLKETEEEIAEKLRSANPSMGMPRLLADLQERRKKLQSYIESSTNTPKEFNRRLAEGERVCSGDVCTEGRPSNTKERSLTLAEWRSLLNQIDKNSPRNGLIARLILFEEVDIPAILEARLSQVYPDIKTIVYKIRESKRGTDRPAIFGDRAVSYPSVLFDQIQDYISVFHKTRLPGSFIFITNQNRPVVSSSIYKSLERTSLGLISPEILHETYLSFYRSGISTSEYLK